MEGIVVVGAGQAGIGAAVELRRSGFVGTITVVGREPHAPYQRPPLSKGLLIDGVAPGLSLYPPRFYEDHAITLVLGSRVTSIDRTERRVTLDSGGQFPYDHLLLATGSRPRPLVLEGLKNALTLRTIDDAHVLAEGSKRWKRAIIVGGGFIGLELASFLRSRDIRVTVIEAASQLMGRVVSPTTAQFFHQFHTAGGVEVVFGRAPLAAQDNGRVIELDNGHVIESDVIIGAIGALANDELAAESGLAVDRGIVVDCMLRTSDPAISAIGDCAVHPDPITGRPVRLESVQNAVDQGKSFAAGIVGAPAAYRSVPWFWSTQGSAKLQIAGLAPRQTDDIVRPTTEGRLSVFRFEGDRLVAVETVNQPGDHLIARRLLAAAKPVSREAVADASVDLRSLL